MTAWALSQHQNGLRNDTCVVIRYCAFQQVQKHPKTHSTLLRSIQHQDKINKHDSMLMLHAICHHSALNVTYMYLIPQTSWLIHMWPYNWRFRICGRTLYEGDTTIVYAWKDSLTGKHLGSQRWTPLYLTGGLEYNNNIHYVCFTEETSLQHFLVIFIQDFLKIKIHSLYNFLKK